MTAKKTAAKKSTTTTTNGNNGNGAKTAPPAVTLNKAFSTMSVEDIQAQLEARRDQEVTELKARLGKIQAEGSTVEARIRELTGRISAKRGGGGGGGGKRGPRAKNEHTVAQVLHQILSKAAGPMTVKDLSAALKESEYKSNAKNLYQVTFAALKSNEGMFSQVSRGTYQAI